MTDRHEIAIIGSGFAGSLLARLLAVLGRDVVLLERDDHPRFALGESSTPLGNLALERLARRYDQPDLYSLAAHGRWLRDFPELGRGLKRGFTFYDHQRDEVFRPGSENRHCLMVAASPDDAVADNQWLRCDVDRHFLERAVAAGARYLPFHEVTAVEESSEGMLLEARRSVAGTRESDAGQEESRRVLVDFVIDASGRAGVLPRALGLDVEPPERAPVLLYSHFEGLVPFRDVAGLDAALHPYPEEWSAVHHLTAQGWMYQLRFDDGLTSVGFLVSDPQLDASDPEAAFHRLVSGYPSLERQFERARAIFPIASARPAGRASSVHGRRWALLPHAYAFFDPLFSTGIAWSVLAVERLAEIFGDGPLPESGALARYGELLTLEADHLERLIGAAQSTLDDFELFVAWSHVYFRAASYQETVQRLLEPAPGDLRGWAWQGFLGAEDPILGAAVERFGPQLGALVRGQAGRAQVAVATHAERTAWLEELHDTLEPRNVAGLDDPRRENLYPVDFAPVVEHCERLGLSRAEAERALPRLRSPEDFAA